MLRIGRLFEALTDWFNRLMGATEMAAFNAAKKYYDESATLLQAAVAELQRTNQWLAHIANLLERQASSPVQPFASQHARPR